MVLEGGAISAHIIGEPNIDRWQQYGAPSTPAPLHRSSNRLFHQLALNEDAFRPISYPLRKSRAGQDSCTNNPICSNVDSPGKYNERARKVRQAAANYLGETAAAIG